jgi:hypothetical protein
MSEVAAIANSPGRAGVSREMRDAGAVGMSRAQGYAASKNLPFKWPTTQRTTATRRPRSERHRRHSDASPELIPHTRRPTLLRCRRRQLRLPANRRIRQALAY